MLKTRELENSLTCILLEFLSDYSSSAAMGSSFPPIYPLDSQITGGSLPPPLMPLGHSYMYPCGCTCPPHRDHS